MQLERGCVNSPLKAWSAARLAAAMSELADAVLQSRRNSDLADTIVDRALLAVAARARQARG